MSTAPKAKENFVRLVGWVTKTQKMKVKRAAKMMKVSESEVIRALIEGTVTF